MHPYSLPLILSGWGIFILLRYFQDNPPLPLHLSEFIMLGFILLITFLIGQRLLLSLGFQEVSPTDRPSFPLRFFLFATALGFGVIALFTLILGQFTLLYPGLPLGFCFLFLLLDKSSLTHLFTQIYIGLIRAARQQPQLQNLYFSLERSLLWLVFFIMVFLSLIHAITPPVFFDTLLYHLGLPNLYIQDHKISDYPYLVYSYYPLNMEMIYTFSLLLYKSHVLPALLHWLIGILTALSIYELSQQFFNKKIGLLALLIFYSTPLVLMLSTVAKNDLLLAYFEITSLFSLLLWFEEEQRGNEEEREMGSISPQLPNLPTPHASFIIHHSLFRSSPYLVLSAILCGFAMGTKYTGGYFFMTICLLVLFHVWTERKRHQAAIQKHRNTEVQEQRKTILPPRYYFTRLLTFSLVAGLVASPWFIRNFILTKNPFYPALSKIFGVGKYLRPELKELTLTGLNPDVLASVRLPWDMTFHQLKFGSFSHIGPIFLIFLPFLFFLFWRRDRSNLINHSYQVKYLGWFSLLFFIFWAVTVPTTRFYLSGLGILAVLIAYLLITLMNTIETKYSSLLKYLIYLVIGFIVVHNIYLFIYLESFLFNPLPVSLNLKSEEEYLISQVDYYPAAQFINKNLPSEVKILLLGETRSYYIQRPMLLNTAQNTTILVDLIKASKGMPDLLDQLKNLGITHILFNSQEARRLQRDYFYFNFPGKREENLYNQFIKNHLKQLFLENGVYVFEIRY